MKFRRVRTVRGLQLEHLDDGQWRALTGASPLASSPFTDEWELATADRHLQHTDALLPFQPLSFRDFMLSERHNIDAARGMIGRFSPATNW